MKPDKNLERIERALWNAGREPAPFTGSPDWQNGVMAAIRRIGPLAAPSSGMVYANAWSWATALAACLAIGVCWYAFIDLNTDTILEGLLLDDPAGLTVNMLMAEM